MENLSENALQWIQFGKIIAIAVFSLLYGFGGIKGKYKRRYLGPIFITAILCLFSHIQGNFSLWYLFYCPLLIGALSLGYGADETRVKILQRLKTGGAGAFAALPIAIVTGQWLMYGLHIILCIFMSVILGVNNPISARGEETVIGATYVFLPLYFIG